MRNAIVRKIIMYVAVWGILFLILCVVSIVKNWNILSTVIGGTLLSLFGYLVVIGLIIYGIVMILRA